jgi:beta-glucosidase
LRRDGPALFARYVEQVVRHVGPHVGYWLTINEPTVYAVQGYILGAWPPCRTASWAAAGQVLRNLARAHSAAYRVLHTYQPEVRVGFAHSAPVIEPCDPRRVRDRFAAAVRNAVLNHAFFQLIGTRTSPVHRVAHLDFLGLNYYTRNVVRSSGWGLGALVGRECKVPHHGNDGAISATGWEIYPAGLRATLNAFSRYGVPMIVTENGVATDDDAVRRKYLADHLAVLAEATDAGVDVFGYLHWSLIDNFEWALGTTARFGLAAVDVVSQERTVKPSARFFERVCRENRLPPRS